MLNPFLYILDGRVPVLCPDVVEWGRWYESADRHVAITPLVDVEGEVVGRVSTVFLGIDHNFWPDGEPLLFETMVFHDLIENICHRTRNWDAALAMHDQTVQEVQDRLWLIQTVDNVFEP